MVLNTLANGITTMLLEAANSSTLKEMSMTESGPIIKQMASASILTHQVHDMKVTGKKINNMVKELKDGQKVQLMKAIITMD